MYMYAAHPGGVAWAAGLGRRADAPVGGRDDPGRVHDAAGRLTIRPPGRVLPWASLLAGSVASLAANVAVAEPSMIGRVIAAWPSFALTASFELLTRQVRRGAAGQVAHHDRRQPPPARPAPAERGSAPGLRVVGPSRIGRSSQRAGGALRLQAWYWALAHRGGDGMLPSGEAIARAHGRQERWGRLVKNAGQAGAFGTEHAQLPRLAADEGRDGFAP